MSRKNHKPSLDDLNDNEDFTDIAHISDFHRSQDDDEDFVPLDDLLQDHQTSIGALESTDNDLLPDLPVSEDDQEAFFKEKTQISDLSDLSDFSEFNEGYNVEVNENENESESKNENENENENQSESDFYGQSFDEASFDKEMEDVPSPTPSSSPIPSSTPTHHWQEVKQFAENISIQTDGNFLQEATPPFTLLAEKITIQEDREAIAQFLKDEKILTPENESELLSCLNKGYLIFPRISEYAAIVLAHHLRRYQLDCKVGPSSLIQPSSTHGEENLDKGPVTRKSLMQNQGIYQKIQNTQDIITSTTEQISGYEIINQLGVISTRKKFSEVGEDVNKIYAQLVEELKEIAYTHGGQGVIGIQFNHISPQEILATGNIVCLQKQ